MLNTLLKHSFLWVVLLLILFVISFSFIPSVRQFQKSFNGDSEKIKYPGFSKKSLQSHELQKYTETLFEKNIRFRKKFISFNNQLYYALFKKSFAVDSQVIIGKNKQFYVLSYLVDYCKASKNPAEIVKWADQIAILNHSIRSQGKIFLYVMTPSKAEQIPEGIPYRFHCKTRGIRDVNYQMDQLLTERAVPHVNGPDLINQATRDYHVAMFTSNGIHWNWLGATVEAVAIIDALRLNSDLQLPKIEFTYHMTKAHPEDTDRDTLSLAQLWEHRFEEKVPQVHFLNPPYSGKPITASVIGGSFNWSLNKIFLKNKIFSEIDYYFYFDKHQKLSANDKKSDWSTDIAKAEIFKADVIILEENASVLISGHGKRFFEKVMERV